MAHFKDLTGQRFGRLLVVGLIRRSGIGPSGKRVNSMWECLCDCGEIAYVNTGPLTTGKQESCGCLRLENVTKHGLHKDPLYSIWLGIWHRCFNPSHMHYDRYGGRGVTMSPEWVSDVGMFISEVREALGDRPSEKHTIDRVDNDGDYVLKNLKWSTQIEQANNRSSTVWLTYGGVTLSMALMCEKLDLDQNTVGQRIRRGWTTDRALSTPTRYPFSRKTDKTIRASQEVFP